MARNIYTDYETEQIIRKIQQLNPDLNLASFFKEKVLELAGELAKKNLDISYLKERRAILESQKQDIQGQIAYFDAVLEDAEGKKLEKEKEKEETSEAEESKKEERLKTFSQNMKEFFNIRSDKKIQELAEEFEKEREQNNSITLFDFMQLKGIKEKAK